MYLFLAIPNFCGSTLMHSVLETSPTVVPLKSPSKVAAYFGGKTDFVEGNVCAPLGYKHLNGPHSMEANMEHVYADPSNYNWQYIKSIWEENWANNNPYAEIKLQKTPADIFRMQYMLPHFPNTKWIISLRNPYAYVESIMRKATFGMDPIRQLDQVCFHVLRTLEVQIFNYLLVKDTTYLMTYEDFAAKPEYHAEKLIEWEPRLLSLNLDAELMVKGKHVTSIKDDSDEKFQALLDNNPGILDKINVYFAPFESLINKWGYRLIK